MVFIPRAQPHAQSLFLFPIVFGIILFRVLSHSPVAHHTRVVRIGDRTRDITPPAAALRTKACHHKSECSTKRQYPLRRKDLQEYRRRYRCFSESKLHQ